MTKNNIAFVLGNGTSRKDISLNSLKDIGITYGCNALYRTFSPHYLISVDSKMVHEINNAGYQQKHSVWTNYKEEYKNLNGFNYFKEAKGWSSGPTALWLASHHMYDTIFMLGFDFIGLDGNINNLYAGTPNYLDTDASETYYENWINQTSTVIKENPQTNYVRVKDNNFVSKKLSSFINYKEEFINTFRERMFDEPI